MSDEKIIKVRMPSFTRLFIGGLAAYWLSTIMNPAFVAIGFLVILMIPVLTVDNMFSRQFSSAYKPPEPVKPKPKPKAVEEDKEEKPKVVKTAVEQKLEKLEQKKEKHHKAKQHH